MGILMFLLYSVVCFAALFILIDFFLKKWMKVKLRRIPPHKIAPLFVKYPDFDKLKRFWKHPRASIYLHYVWFPYFTSLNEEKAEEYLDYWREEKEVSPPWVKHPDYGPSDGFWKQSGETWYTYVWLPYWNSLNEKERKKYLKRWNIPDEWTSSVNQT